MLGDASDVIAVPARPLGRPDGLVCATYRLPDGVTFVHVIAHDKDPGGTGAYRT